MIDKGYDCTFDTWERQSGNVTFPCYLENTQRHLELLYPFEVMNAILDNDKQLALYESLDLCMFTTVSFLDTSIITENAGELFRYRIKEKFTQTGRNITNHNQEALPPKFSFELNILNISQLTEKSCLLLRDSNDSILFKNSNESEKYCELHCSIKLKELSEKFAENTLKINTCKF